MKKHHLSPTIEYEYVSYHRSWFCSVNVLDRHPAEYYLPFASSNLSSNGGSLLRCTSHNRNENRTTLEDTELRLDKK